MGDLPGHPFRGNQYTAGGITATFNPRLTSEARNVGAGKYEVGPKFFELPSDEVRVHVLKHEEGHDLSDAMLADGSAWRALDDGVLPADLNGQTTPGEILAEAYALFHTDRPWLEKNHPRLAAFVRSELERRSWTPARNVGR